MTAANANSGGSQGGSPFVNIDPLVVNLAPPDVDRYLQLAVAYEVSDDKAVEQFKTFMPIVRSRILLVLSTKAAGDLTSTEGKHKLMDQLLEVARYTLPATSDDPAHGVKDVHLTSFVIQ